MQIKHTCGQKKSKIIYCNLKIEEAIRLYIKNAIDLGLIDDAKVKYENGTYIVTDYNLLVEMTSMKQIIMQIFYYRPIDFFLGNSAIFPHAVTCGLWSFVKHTQINIRDGVGHLPKTAYFSNHHKTANYKYDSKSDIIMQFFFYRHFKEIKVLYDYGLRDPFFAKIQALIFKHVFNGQQLNYTTSSEERFYNLVLQLQQGSAISVFPDRDGAQFYEDDSFVFRPGLFAASIFHQVPIIDICIAYPTRSVNVLDIDFNIWVPPQMTPGILEGSSKYKEWRDENKKIINEFALECENDYRQRLCLLRDSKVCCDKEDAIAICNVKDFTNVKKHYERNLSARSVLKP